MNVRKYTYVLERCFNSMERKTEIAFGPFRLDPQQKKLWKGDEELKLGPTATAVLQVLIEQAGQLVSQEELLQEVWAETAVSKKALQGCIRQIREVLGDSVARPNYIETITRQGYRFLAPVVDMLAGAVSAFPFVGRDTEQSQLHTYLRRALARERQVVFVTGEPGIGKSTLVEQLLRHVRQSSRMSIGLGQCLEQYGEGEAYLPILDALSRLCKGKRSGLCRRVLSRHAPSWMLQMSGLLSEEERAALQQQVQGMTRQRMVYELAEGLEALSAEIPLILVLEDLHWSDYSTIEFISHLARRREPARLLIIGTYRPGDIAGSTHPLKSMQQELSLRGECQELALQRLAPDDIAAYIALRFPDNTVGDAIAQTVYERTEGNALFMLNVVNVLASRDPHYLLDPDKEYWERKEDTATIDIPATLQQMIATRLDKLTATDRQALEAASLIGRDFSAAAVAAAIEQDTVQVEDVCVEIARHGQFLESTGPSEWPDGTVATQFRFSHELYREILSAEITAGRRIRLHQRIGERLEAGYGAQCKEVAGDLAIHFEHGRDYARAIQHLQQAAENANFRCAYHEAILHLRKGLQLLEHLPDTIQRAEQELMLQAALGATFISTQGFAAKEVEQAYSRARTLCQQVDDSPQLPWVLRGLTAFYSVRAEHQVAYGLAKQCFDLATARQDRIFLVGAHLELASALIYLGDFSSALQFLEKGTLLYNSQEHDAHAFVYGQHFGVSCLTRMAAPLWYLGYPEQALEKSREALALARKQPHTFSLAYALAFVAVFHSSRREWDITQRYAEEVITLSAEHGFPIWAALGNILRGAALAMQGQAKEGIILLREGLEAWRDTGAEVAQPRLLALFIEAYLQLGMTEEGGRVLDEAFALLNKSDERWWEAELYRVKGELLLARKTRESVVQEADVEQCFQTALDVARSQSAKAFELRAAMSLGRLWKKLGRGDDALRLLEEIYNWFTEGFDTTDLREAKILIEQLSA